MRMASAKMINYAANIEEFFGWAGIPYEQWKDDSFDVVYAWLNKYVPIYKREYAKRGRAYEEWDELMNMDSWCLSYM